MTTGWGDTSFAKRNPRETWQRGLGGVLDYACASDTRAIVVLLIFALLAFLPGQAKIPPIDRDEARAAQATKQMVDTGDYVDIRYQNDVRYENPVGIHWMQSAALKTAELVIRREMDNRISVYRIPSLIGAVGAVIATFWVASVFVSRRGAILAGVMMASSILLGFEARLAKADAMLLFMVLLCVGVLARAYLPPPEDRPDSRALPYVFWVALAVGVLLKGPLILMLIGLPIVALVAIDRSVSWLKVLRPAIGIVIFLVLVLPWFVAIQMRAGTSFFSESIGTDLSKLYRAQNGHGAPPGYFLVLFFFTFWPASLLAGMAVPGVWRDKWEAPVKFLLAWLVPAWLIFEIAITKLPHYVLPLYPAIAILLARAIETGEMTSRRWMEWGLFWWFAVPVIVFVGSLVLLLGYEGELGWRAWPFLAAATVFGFRAWWLYEVDGAERSLLQAAVTTVLLAIAVYWSVVPSLAAVFPSVAIQRTVHASECPEPRIAAAGFHEPSMVFLSGTDTALTSAAGAADFLKAGADDCRFAVVEHALERAFARRAEAIGLRYTQASRFRGYSLGSGGRVAFTIYRARR